MPLQQFLNGNATTTANADATSGSTTITPLATTGFPGSPQFTILNRRTGELMMVTAVNAGPTWTVVRGFGGSTAAAVIGTGGTPDNLDYSITREMLLLGFVMKLDEAIMPADTASGTLTLTVPTWAQGLGLRGVRVELSIMASTAVGGNTYLQMRLNGDTATTTYFTDFAYWGSSSTSGTYSGLAYARTGYSPRRNLLVSPTNFNMLKIDFGGVFDTDRWSNWVSDQRLTDGSGGGHQRMIFAGHWQNTAAVTTFAFAVDNDAAPPNGGFAAGTMVAGSRAVLYGVP